MELSDKEYNEAIRKLEARVQNSKLNLSYDEIIKIFEERVKFSKYE